MSASGNSPSALPAVPAGAWPQRSTPLRAAPLVPVPRVAASASQRLKVVGAECVVCGRTPVDPAHLVPQRLGGCGHPDCVVPLCRTHHRLFDCARLRLGPYLGPEFETERSHALTHVGEEELEEALKGGGWPAPWLAETK